MQNDRIKESLIDYKKKFFQNELFKGSIICLALLLTTFLVMVVIEYWGHFSSEIRAFLFYGFLLLALSCFGYYIIYPAINLFNASKKMSDEDAAKQLGNFFPSINDKLLNIIQLQKLGANSSELVLASINQKSSQLKGISFEKAIDKSLLKKYGKAFLIIILFISILLLLKRELITSGSKRIIKYDQHFEVPAPFDFIFLNEQYEVNRTEDYTFRLKIEGEIIPERVNVVVDKKSYVMRNDQNGKFSFELHNIKSNKTFYYSASGYSSNSKELIAVDLPSINMLDVKINFPSYQKKTSKKMTNTGSFSIPEGSEVVWKINASHTKSVSFLFDSLNFNVETKDKQSFTFSKKVYKNTEYKIRLNDKIDQKGAYQIAVVKDQYPRIEVNELKDSILNDFIFITGRISDDYGFSKLSFVYEGINSKGKKQQFEKILNKKIVDKTFLFNYRIDIDSLNLKEGEASSYHVVVWDNDGVNGKKSTKSSLFTITLPSKKEIYEQIKKSENQTKNEMKSLEKELKKIQEELMKVQDQLK